MPMFEFHCQACNADFEELLASTKEIKQVVCPRCRGRKVVRKISSFAARVAQAARSNPGCPMSSRSCDSCSAFNGTCQF